MSTVELQWIDAQLERLNAKADRLEKDQEALLEEIQRLSTIRIIIEKRVDNVD